MYQEMEDKVKEIEVKTKQKIAVASGKSRAEGKAEY
jgi:hypothetical protein